MKYNNIKNKRVLLRLDLNVPINKDKIEDDYRIVTALPTIELLLKNKNQVIIISHLGDEGESIALVHRLLAKYCKDRFKQNLKLIEGNDIKIVKKEVENMFDNLSNKEDEKNILFNKARTNNLIMLENIRNFKGEKENSASFARALASLAQVYVYDAFAVAHRKHASVVSVARYLPHCVGPLIMSEIAGLKYTQKINNKTLIILGGAKISTKLPLIDRYIDNGATVFVGGAMAHNIMLSQGISIGKSLYDKEINNKTLSKKKSFKTNRLYIPYDYVTDSGKVGNTAHTLKNQAIMDLGPETFSMIKKLIDSHKVIIMNGPLGLYEKGFDKGSVAIIKYLASEKNKDKITIAGGGDTVTLIDRLKLAKRFDYVSTGGGAMLYYMENSSLPGIEANK